MVTQRGKDFEDNFDSILTHLKKFMDELEYQHQFQDSRFLTALESHSLSFMKFADACWNGKLSTTPDGISLEPETRVVREQRSLCPEKETQKHFPIREMRRYIFMSKSTMFNSFLPPTHGH